MQLFLKTLSGIANSVDPDQTASSLIWVCTVCICHFLRHFGVPNFRTFTLVIFSAHMLLSVVDSALG